PPSPAAGQLQAANQAEVQRVASEAARQSAVQSAAEWRRGVVVSATRMLGMLIDRLGQSIHDNAPAAVWRRIEGKFLGAKIQLGSAVLAVGSVEELREVAWGQWAPAFQVIAHSA